MNSFETYHADFIDAQYRRWQQDPQSVSTDWQFFFKGFEAGSGAGARMTRVPAALADDRPPAAVDVEDMLRQAKADGVRLARVHVLFDGRDVGEKSAETYVERLEACMSELRDDTYDVQVASGGGRMHITMDRYEADWKMVQRGWQTHVRGEGRPFESALDAVDVLRTPYRIDILQPVYFVIDSFDDLFDLAGADLLGYIAEARRLGMHEPLFEPKAAAG